MCMYKIWYCACVCAKLLQSCLTLCDPVDPKVALQAPLSMGSPRQECWRGLPFPSPGDLPDLRIESPSLTSHALAGGFFTTSATSEDHIELYYISKMDVFSGFAQKFI